MRAVGMTAAASSPALAEQIRISGFRAIEKATSFLRSIEPCFPSLFRPLVDVRLGSKLKKHTGSFDFARFSAFIHLLLRPQERHSRPRLTRLRDTSKAHGEYREDRVCRRVGPGSSAARPSRVRLPPRVQEGRLGASSRRDASRVGRHRQQVLAPGPTR
jgi:hypothetical protein